MSDVEEITKLIKQSTDYQVNKTILREKIQTDLHFAYNGGLFKITPELIMFASSWPRYELLYLEDTYGNPIEITDTEYFGKLAKQHYQKVMNRWHQEHAELKRIRKV